MPEENGTVSVRPRVVIIGGGFAGLAAAKALRRADAEIVVVDRNNYHLFQPLLYQVATAGLSPGNIAHPIRSILKSSRNTRVLMATVRGIDRSRRVVTLDDGELNYDHLIVAAGMVNHYFGHDDWESAAPALKDIRDALDIRLRILGAFEAAERETDEAARAALMTFVVVGAGPTGVELAGAIREIAGEVMVGEFRRIDTRAARVVLVEAADRVLPAFPEKLSGHARRSLDRLRVEVRTNTLVSDISAAGARLGDEWVAARTVLWTAGVKASPIAESLGVPLDRAGRVIVNNDLTVSGDDRVYVIGDLARFEQDGRVLPGMAPVAIQQGAHAARNVLAAIENRPSSSFVFRDKGQMATIGRGAAVADVFGLRFGGRLAWLAWLFIHITQLIGFENRLSVMLQWAYAYLAFQRSARLIIR